MIDLDLIKRPLSYSQMTDFLTCRYRWYLKYVLGIRPKVRAVPMEIGDAVHRALAEFLSGGNPEDGVNAWYRDLYRQVPYQDPEIEQRLDGMQTTAQAIVDRALSGLEDLGFWTYNDPQTGRPLVETDWTIDIPHWPGGFVVKLDWVAYDPLNKRIWVADFKTRGYFTSEDDEWANLQNTIYQAAALSKGIDSVGTLTIQIQSTPPKQPKLNKPKAGAKAEMSRAAVACDWKTYEQALLAHGLDPLDYQDMREKLQDKEFVKIVPVIRSVETVRRIWDDVVEPVAAQMYAAWEELARFGAGQGERAVLSRFLSPRTCNGCGVRPLCHGPLKGYGVRDTLLADFNTKPGAERAFPE